jgi:hypothetical protein
MQQLQKQGYYWKSVHELTIMEPYVDPSMHAHWQQRMGSEGPQSTTESHHDDLLRQVMEFATTVPMKQG